MQKKLPAKFTEKVYYCADIIEQQMFWGEKFVFIFLNNYPE